jgi:DNA polymerase III psi subunit
MNKAEAEQIYTEELYRLPKKVLVLMPQSWDSLNAEEETLLTKILASIRLPLSAVQVLSLNNCEIDSLKIYNPSHVLSFGTKLIHDTKPFSTEVIHGIQIVQSETLGNLDDLKKKSLWTALKQAFAL